MSGHGKRPTEKGTFTNWRRQREGLVRTQKETVRAGGTHVLETAEGETCQDMERNRPSEAHSLSGDGRGRDLSEHGKNPTERGTLTLWRRQTCQGTERNRPGEAHSLPGDGRGTGLSGQGKNTTKRGTLTSWRRQREGLVRTRKETD